MRARTFTKYLTPAEEKALIKWLKSLSCEVAKRDLYLFELVRSTGMRIQTALGLSYGHALDGIQQGFLDQLPADIFKRRRPYVIPLNQRAITAIKGMMNHRDKLGIKVTISQPQLVYSPRTKTPGVKQRAILDRFTSHYKAIKIARPLNVHAIRHTFAVRYMAQTQNKNALATLMALMGHSSISSTLVYTWPTLEDIQKASTEASS